jgi:hypothetical protein
VEDGGNIVTRFLTEEEIVALRALCRELGIDRHDDFRVQRHFLCSAGRIYLRDWRRQDAVDPEYVVVGGKHRPIHGHVEGPSGPINLEMKWGRRAGLYLDTYGDDLRHVRDWLYVVGREVPRWVHDVDEFARPRKFLKPGSIPELRRFADREWSRMRRPEMPTRELTDEDVREVMDLGDGYTLVQLLSPEALDAETAALRHCVGHGWYDSKLAMRGTAIYSIRDEHGVARATIEVSGRLVIQIRGYLNEWPGEHVQRLFDAGRPSLGIITVEEADAMVQDAVEQAIGKAANEYGAEVLDVLAEMDLPQRRPR